MQYTPHEHDCQTHQITTIPRKTNHNNTHEHNTN